MSNAEPRYAQVIDTGDRSAFICTYILKSESGVSIKAAGWRLVGEVRGRSWDAPSRRRVDRHPTEDKLLWETAA